MKFDAKTFRPSRPLRRLPIALALALAVSPVAIGAHAQDAGLRGTTEEESLASSPLVKKRKLKPVAAAAAADTDQGRDSNGSVAGLAASNEDAAVPTAYETSGGTDETVTSEDPFAGEELTGSTTAAAPRQMSADEEPLAAVTRVESEGALERDGVGPLGRENERTDAIEGKNAAREDDPFAAPGIRSGTFVIRPTLESGIRYGSNPNDPTCVCATTQAETTVTVRAESDWIRHGLNLEMRGTADKPFSDQSGTGLAPEFNGGFRIAADGRLDISVSDTATFAASAERARETLSSGSSTGYASRSMQTSLRAAAGYSHDAGPVGLSVNGQVTHTSYGDALSLAGVALPQDDRDNLNASVTLRGTYELSGAVSPFAEVEVGRRLYDNKFDSSGIEQSATRYAVRAGAEFNQGEKLTGELAAGWFVENPDDASLQDVSGLDLRGTFNWSPVRDTTVTVIASTAIDGASSTSAESSVNYNVSADFKRKLRSNIDGNILLSASVRDYTGSLDTQTTLGAEAGLTWWFNRFAGVNGKVNYSQTSGIAGGSRDSVGAYLGLILRR